ncbi:molybdenum cofactor biosynthesis protein C [bacterium CG2_30_54_10]|nr:MAG: molybdenum cofactor biosynthesis protein C [bacterium CG2_30_54_10]
MTESNGLTHLDSGGRVKMVDVGLKSVTTRRALAFGVAHLGKEASSLLFSGKLAKGDALAASRVAGIMAAKRASELIPLTHPIRLDAVGVHLFALGDDRLGVIADARATDRTGVEMEAMVGASVALLNIYDMVKGVTKSARIEGIRLIVKTGGKSGAWWGDGVLSGRVEKLAISKSKGTPKDPIDESDVVMGFGLAGDAHGGDWHRQISLLGIESINTMKEKGLAVDFGSFAENIATSGIKLFALPIGTLLAIGKEVILEITQIGKECHTRCAVYYKAGDCVMPREGIFARILQGGKIRAADEILVIPRSV